MRFDRRGMVAVMDAMFFIIILGLVVSAIFVYMPQSQDGPSSESVHKDLMRTELRFCDVFDGEDTRTVRMDTVLAAHTLSGKGDIDGYLHDVLRSMIPAQHGFVFTYVFNDGTPTVVSDGYGRSVSSNIRESDIAGGVLRTTLEIL